MKKLLYIQILTFVIFIALIIFSHITHYNRPHKFVEGPTDNVPCPPGMRYESALKICADNYTFSNGKLTYLNDKFNITFTYDKSHPLIDPLREMSSSDFTIDASSNGREWRCPLPNNSVRVYSEKEVSDGNINVTNCNYMKPDIDELASGMFNASWSKDVYGPERNVKDIIIGGQPARLVYGSTKVRTLIILLPSPYTEAGYKYDFLNITADYLLAEDIITTLKFR